MIDRILLAPYYLALKFRHFLYDHGILKSVRASVPTVCFGNITVGGTGKTPHTEMTLRTLLSMEEAGGRHFAVLSRGYRRKSRGFQQVTADSTASFSGDEPLQMKLKFPEVTVAVDADRVEGCGFLSRPEKLKTSKRGRKCVNKEFLPADLIVLDDAFQHRSLKPDLSILLIDWNRPVMTDHLLPIGRLRDLKERVAAADAVIVTKCPANISPIEKRIISKQLNLKAYQQLLFTTMEYGSILTLEGKPAECHPSADSTILCVTGIAAPAPYHEHLRSMTPQVINMAFPDHHNFREADIQRITEEFHKISANEKYIFTTEKDAMRLKLCPLPDEIKGHLYYIPIEPVFLTPRDQLTKTIHDYVRKNKRK